MLVFLQAWHRQTVVLGLMIFKLLLLHRSGIDRHLVLALGVIICFGFFMIVAPADIFLKSACDQIVAASQV